MALTPAAMMNLRRGPTQGATPNPGGAPPAPMGGLPGTPGGDPGNLLMSAIAEKMSQAKKSNANFATGNIDQMLRVIGVMQIHIQQMHPETAHHLNKAWAALSAAKKSMGEFAKDETMPGRPLGFSGAGIGPTQAGPMGVGPGNGGGGMGGPT